MILTSTNESVGVYWKMPGAQRSLDDKGGVTCIDFDPRSGHIDISKIDANGNFATRFVLPELGIVV